MRQKCGRLLFPLSSACNLAGAWHRTGQLCAEKTTPKGRKPWEGSTTRCWEGRDVGWQSRPLSLRNVLRAERHPSALTQCSKARLFHSRQEGAGGYGTPLLGVQLMGLFLWGRNRVQYHHPLTAIPLAILWQIQPALLGKRADKEISLVGGRWVVERR